MDYVMGKKIDLYTHTEMIDLPYRKCEFIHLIEVILPSFIGAVPYRIVKQGWEDQLA
jgi:hypothetical protein